MPGDASSVVDMSDISTITSTSSSTRRRRKLKKEKKKARKKAEKKRKKKERKEREEREAKAKERKKRVVRAVMKEDTGWLVENVGDDDLTLGKTTLLHLAAGEGLLNSLQVLLRLPRAITLLTSRDSRGLTPIETAHISGHHLSAHLLLSARSSSGARTPRQHFGSAWGRGSASDFYSLEDDHLERDDPFEGWGDDEVEESRINSFSWMDEISADYYQRKHEQHMQEEARQRAAAKAAREAEKRRRREEREKEKEAKRRRVQGAATPPMAPSPPPPDEHSMAVTNRESFESYRTNPPSEVRYASFPWPALLPDGSFPLEVGIDRRQSIRKLQLLWHPDKIEQSFGPRMQADKGVILQRAKELAQVLNNMA